MPRALSDTAAVPGASEPLRLLRRGADWSIMLDANEVVNSRLAGSEEALARAEREVLYGAAGVAAAHAAVTPGDSDRRASR